MENIKEIINKIFLYNKPKDKYDFSLSEKSNLLKNDNKQSEKEKNKENQKAISIYPSLTVNLDYLKSEFNPSINSDIIFRKFSLCIKEKEYKACLIFIDGMVDSNLINDFLLKPLMKNIKSNHKVKPIAIANNISVRRTKKFNLENYIYNFLIPQNNIKKIKTFNEVITSVNSGECALLVDTLNLAFTLDVKGFETRSISSPQNETVVRGSQEAFVEKIRTNTSMLRRIINNENLIIENTSVGKVSNTKVAICYMKNIANESLVLEVKHRIENLDVDSIISSGQLEQLIQDDSLNLFPQIIATERPDKAANHLLEGRVVVLVNGSPYSLIMPAILMDFLSSPEDINLKFQYSNLLKFIRILAFIITLFLPGFYIAITTYHTELIPTELLFTIAASRNTVPFPIIFEIFLMELSFELIREAGLRVPSPIGPTIRNCRCPNTSEKLQ